MSKTLTGILEIAAGIALEFVPGAQAIGTSLIITGVTTTAAALLTGQQTARPDVTETAVKSPTPARVSAYGKSRLPFSIEYAE